MQNLYSFLVAAILFTSSSAFAFIPRLDATDYKTGKKVLSIVSASDASIFDLNHKVVTYVGRPVEAKALVEALLAASGPSDETYSVVELNPATGTISVRYVPTNSFGPTLVQLIITRAGD